MRLDLPLGVDVLVVGAIRYGPQSHVNTGFDTFAGMCSTRPESSYNQCLVGQTKLVPAFCFRSLLQTDLG